MTIVIFELVTSVFQSVSVLTATAVTCSFEERQTLLTGYNAGQACRSHYGGDGAVVRSPPSHTLSILPEAHVCP